MMEPSCSFGVAEKGKMDRHQNDHVEHYFTADDNPAGSAGPKTRHTWSHLLRHELDWPTLRNLTVAHLLAFWGTYRVIFYGFVSYKTFFFTYVLAVLSGIGALAGAHRYWSHRAFKAHWIFKLFLLICQTTSGQRSVIRWAQEHRTHHRFTGTDADCVNINRGFFFAHIGWLLMKPTPECARRMAECDVSDLTSDKLIKFQYDHYPSLMIICNAVIPTLIPYFYFGESLLESFLCAFALRYVYSLHVAFSGNSVLHYFGSKPYDKRASSTQCTFMIWATLGAAYHNYHHKFPYDYMASEYGPLDNFNLNTVLINFCAKLGLAYDLKRASPQTIAYWKHKYGDPLEATPKRSAILDWTLGLLFSAVPIWLILAGRFSFISLQTLGTVQ